MARSTFVTRDESFFWSIWSSCRSWLAIVAACWMRGMVASVMVLVLATG